MTRRRPTWALAALVGLLVATLALGAPRAAVAQDGFGSGGGDGSEVLPEPHIIPRPNSGHAPEDAGDRGGSLQLLLLGLMVVAVSGGVLYVVRESRRARAARDAGRT